MEILLSPWVTVPAIGAFIGWITNLLAVKMLFRPRKEVWVLGLRIQGVFPRRQAALAERLGGLVSRELISVPELLKVVDSPATRQELLAHLASRVDGFLWEKLPQSMPMLRMFLSPELVGSIKQALLAEVEGMLPELSVRLQQRVASEVDIHEIVRQKVLALSGEKIEELLLNLMKQEFRFIELVGGVLGLLIGFVQVLVLQLGAL